LANFHLIIALVIVLKFVQCICKNGFIGVVITGAGQFFLTE